ncbi:MAG TPA: SRPBCC domain-containing protein [Solirubrobacteraceae bacterium]|nr:SRPBCC domain-containing protein [Solirubrobacteraceae bacterium]
MTVISTTKDAATLTLTLVAQFDVSPDRVWEVWEDPRKLERWWGPPTFPATFTRHEFIVGGQSRYFMTGPAGEMPRGWWRIDAIDKPRRLEFANGLAGDDGEPLPGVEPMSGHVTFEAVDGGTRMTVVTRFADAEQMQTMLAMGMQEGMTQAIGQIDAVLAPAPV